MRTHESVENYLETVLLLSKRGSVRAVDVAAELGLAKPSVSVAMKNLRSSGHIISADDGSIELTDKGRELAETTYARHVLLRDWLISLGVDGDTAANDACRIEHVISDVSIAAIRRFVDGGGRTCRSDR